MAETWRHMWVNELMLLVLVLAPRFSELIKIVGEQPRHTGIKPIHEGLNGVNR